MTATTLPKGSFAAAVEFFEGFGVGFWVVVFLDLFGLGGFCCLFVLFWCWFFVWFCFCLVCLFKASLV